jgi:DNA-binding response OmpR family regulator
VNSKTDSKIAKVLVVEDHREFLQFLEIALTRRGWDVITSASGQEALDKLEHANPSLILLDMWMPGMDGFELAQFLKTCPRYRAIPILAITGLLSSENRKLCLDAGCDDHLTKPFALQDLEDRMNRLLGRQPARTQQDELRTNVKKNWPI